MTRLIDTDSHWLRTGPLPSYPPLDRDLSVDVVVVGGGLVGISTAYLLRSAGISVALLERDRCAAVDTGHTTAHLTQVTDEPLTRLVDAFGRDTALAVWDAGRTAIDRIEEHVSHEGIDCGFRRVPGLLHTALTGVGLSKDELRRMAALAAELGFAAAYVEHARPFDAPGVRFDHQALFHPRKYLAGLLAALTRDGALVFEHSPADGVEAHPLRVTANGHAISCAYVVLATHTPRAGASTPLGAAMLQSKLAVYSTYALGLRLASGTVPHGLYWDTADPYHYLRVEPAEGADYAIFGGADHKTGQVTDTRACWEGLERTFRRLVPAFEPDARWSGQVVETHDGLPFIGETADRQFVATGFAGNGMTFGTVAAMMARDAVLGRANPWRAVFDPHRTSVRAGGWDYVAENKDYAYYMLRDRLPARHARSIGHVRPGQGKVVSLGGERVAVFRDGRGVLHLCSAICTHMGCEVRFNQGEGTWDCPCHGSRFRPDGSIISGPAEQALGRVE